MPYIPEFIPYKSVYLFIISILRSAALKNPLNIFKDTLQVYGGETYYIIYYRDKCVSYTTQHL